MARNTGRGTTPSTSLPTNPKAAMWLKRYNSTGRFLEAKKNGGSFKGVKVEGRWSLWQWIRSLFR